MSSVTVEKPTATRTGVYQVRKTGKVGVLATENENAVCLYLLGEGVGKCVWLVHHEIEELPPGSRLLAIL